MLKLLNPTKKALLLQMIQKCILFKSLRRQDFECFGNDLVILWSPRLHLFDQKYSLKYLYFFNYILKSNLLL